MSITESSYKPIDYISVLIIKMKNNNLIYIYNLPPLMNCEQQNPDKKHVRIVVVVI